MLTSATGLREVSAAVNASSQPVAVLLDATHPPARALAAILASKGHRVLILGPQEALDASTQIARVRQMAVPATLDQIMAQFGSPPKPGGAAVLGADLTAAMEDAGQPTWGEDDPAEPESLPSSEPVLPGSVWTGPDEPEPLPPAAQPVAAPAASPWTEAEPLDGIPASTDPVPTEPVAAPVASPWTEHEPLDGIPAAIQPAAAEPEPLPPAGPMVPDSPWTEAEPLDGIPAAIQPAAAEPEPLPPAAQPAPPSWAPEPPAPQPAPLPPMSAPQPAGPPPVPAAPPPPSPSWQPNPLVADVRPDARYSAVRRGAALIVGAGGGGVGKTTIAVQIAAASAASGVVPRVLLIDGSRGQADIRRVLHLPGDAPGVFDAAVLGDPAKAVLSPKRANQMRNPHLPPLRFGVVLGPADDQQADPSTVTCEVYRQVLGHAMSVADLVVVDTQISERADMSGMWDQVWTPALAAGAWMLGVSDDDPNSGLPNLAERLAAVRASGVPPDRLMSVLSRFRASQPVNLETARSVLSASAAFMGIIPETPDVSVPMATGQRIPWDAPGVREVLDACLYRMTGQPVFAPRDHGTGRRGRARLFGGRR